MAVCLTFLSRFRVFINRIFAFTLNYVNFPFYFVMAN